MSTHKRSIEKNYLFYFNKTKTSDLTRLVFTNTSKYLFGSFVPDPIENYDLCNLDYKTIQKAKKRGKYIVLDSTKEGFSTIYSMPNIKLIYSMIEQFGLMPSKVIYVTMNLIEQENVANWAKKNNVEPVHVFSRPFLILDAINSDMKTGTSDVQLSRVKEQVYKRKEIDKLVLNLNGRFRPYRSDFAFYLGTSEISQHILLSHLDKFNRKSSTVNFSDRTPKQKKRWSEKTPIIIDNTMRHRFLHHTTSNLHNQTIFELVNETLVEDWYQTSREYSEKTFKPITQFQPFLIYGQKGCNLYLKNLGFRPYHDWFDLSFDEIDDPIDRMMAVYKIVKDTVATLTKMTEREKVEWRFKNESVLIDNYERLLELEKFVLDETKTFFGSLP